MISVLAPALQARAERPTLFLGTSVGAINAAYMGASQHLSADQQAAGLLERWREVTKEGVIRPILRHQLPLTALRYLGGLLSVPGARVSSLLDPTPLARSLERWMSWDDLHRNVTAGVVQGVAVVATAARTGRTVVFIEGDTELARNNSHVLEYVRTELAEEHIRASAAIPVLFPPVRVEKPTDARGWYVDGGTRLNVRSIPATRDPSAPARRSSSPVAGDTPFINADSSSFCTGALCESPSLVSSSWEPCQRP